MTVTVSVAVMAHPTRRRFVDELLTRLDRPATVVWDQRNDRWDTGRRSMLAHDPDASHHLVIQDDAIPCRDLVAGVEKALGRLPHPETSPLCLYLGRVQPHAGKINQLVTRAVRDTSWITMGQLHWGPGIVMPTHLIGDMVAWCDQRSEVPNYDKRISRWCQHQGLTVWYPWPSLVDHRGVTQNPSLIDGRTGNRRAHRFLGADRSALGCDWSGGVVGISSGGQLVDDRTGFNGRWRVIGPCAHASVATDNGQIRARQIFFRGTVLPADVPVADLRHLWSVGLIEPVPEPPAPPAPEAAPDQTQQPAGVEPAADGVVEPSTLPPPPPPVEVQDGTAGDVLAWVGDDPFRAASALAAERARDKPRKSVLGRLTAIAGVDAPPVGVTSPVGG